MKESELEAEIARLQAQLLKTKDRHIMNHLTHKDKLGFIFGTQNNSESVNANYLCLITNPVALIAGANGVKKEFCDMTAEQFEVCVELVDNILIDLYNAKKKM